MATIDGVEKGCPQILYRVNGNSLQPGISGKTMTAMPSWTSTDIHRAWFARTSLPRRAIWIRGRHVAFELVGQVDFLFSLPRCWQSHTTHGRWFFTDISRGIHLVAFHQPAEWFRSESRIYLHKPAEWSWSQKRIYLRQPTELSRCQSCVGILTLPCMLTQYWQTLSFMSMWNVSGTIYDWGRSPLKPPCLSDALCLVGNIHAMPVLTRDRGPRKIGDAINDVSTHVDWCIKWSSFRILNICFLPENLGVLLTADQHFPWTVTAQIFFTLDYDTRFAARIACWRRFENRKEHC